MRVAFRPLAGALRDIPTPPDGSPCAEVPGVECPGCKGAHSDGAFRVHGPEMREIDDRFYRAEIEAHPATMFGLAEDRAMLNGRPRVYG